MLEIVTTVDCGQYVVKYEMLAVAFFGGGGGATQVGVEVGGQVVEVT
jgi:hypothetical protein